MLLRQHFGTNGFDSGELCHRTSLRALHLLGPILALIIAGYFLWMYRRRKSSPTELEATSAPYDDGKTPEKAQLHSDSIPPKKPQEMEGSFAPNSPHEMQGSQRGSVAELPAIEPVGTEMLS